MITKGMATLQVYAGKKSNEHIAVFEDDLSGCLFLYCKVCGATYKEEASFGTKYNFDKWDEFCEAHKHEDKEVKDMLGPYGFGSFGSGLANNTLNNLGVQGVDGYSGYAGYVPVTRRPVHADLPLRILGVHPRA